MPMSPTVGEGSDDETTNPGRPHLLELVSCTYSLFSPLQIACSLYLAASVLSHPSETPTSGTKSQNHLYPRRPHGRFLTGAIQRVMSRTSAGLPSSGVPVISRTFPTRTNTALPSATHNHNTWIRQRLRHQTEESYTHPPPYPIHPGGDHDFRGLRQTPHLNHGIRATPGPSTSLPSRVVGFGIAAHSTPLWAYKSYIPGPVQVLGT